MKVKRREERRTIPDRRQKLSLCSGDLNLTDRESEVFKGLIEGLTGQQICHSLKIQRVTLDFHVSNVKNKLNAKTKERAS